MSSHPEYAAQVDRIVDNLKTFQHIAATANLDTPVPSCGAWTLTDLLKHIADVTTFWNAVIDADGEAPPPSERSADPEPISVRLEAGIAGLHDRLQQGDTTRDIWTWMGPQPINPWLARRLCSEIGIHLWDARNAIDASPTAIEPTAAVDAIHEYFETITFTKAPSDSVHLHATDIDGEWFITADADGRRIGTNEHAKGAVAVRGTASDLLLLLWGRVSASSLETFGEVGILDAWLKPV